MSIGFRPQSDPRTHSRGSPLHEGAVVPEGSHITHNGSLWLAKRTSDERPGDSRDYVLICKQGQVPRE